MELVEYLRAMRKQWLVLILLAVLGGGGGYAASALSTPLYRSQVQLFVSSDGATTTTELAQGLTFVEKRVKSYAEVVRRQIVLEPVIEELDLGLSVKDLAAKVTATAPPDTQLLTIAVTDPDPTTAAEIANAVVVEFQAIAVGLEQGAMEDEATVTITALESARPGEEPVSPNTKVNVALGLLAGLALGFCLAMLRESLDTRVKRTSDVTGGRDLPVLGQMALDRRTGADPLVVRSAPQSLRAEAFRQLRTSLQFVDAHQADRAYVVTSSVPGEGKSTTAVNLAFALADSGLSVCLVEADMRRPSLGGHLGLASGAGLSTVLIGTVDLDDALQQWGTPAIDVLLSGSIPPNPAELLAGAAMDDLLKELRARYDVVVIDSPPLLPATDAAILARRCSGALVVVGVGTVRRDQLSRSLADLTAAGAHVVGAVVNRLPVKGPDAPATAAYAYGPPKQRRRLWRRPGGRTTPVQGAGPTRSFEPEEATAEVVADGGTAQDVVTQGAATQEVTERIAEHDATSRLAAQADADPVEPEHEDTATDGPEQEHGVDTDEDAVPPRPTEPEPAIS